MAASGLAVEASAMHVFPPAMVGMIVEIKPIKPVSSGDRMETTPVGSSREKLKWELATGLTLEKICWYLSHQPA